MDGRRLIETVLYRPFMPFSVKAYAQQRTFSSCQDTEVLCDVKDNTKFFYYIESSATILINANVASIRYL